jgi:hypothetical protein
LAMGENGASPLYYWLPKRIQAAMIAHDNALTLRPEFIGQGHALHDKVDFIRAQTRNSLWRSQPLKDSSNCIPRKTSAPNISTTRRLTSSCGAASIIAGSCIASRGLGTQAYSLWLLVLR